ncbi:MAG: hypothetical protein ACTSRP_01810 [Candidatus Helarchaeota archaeon]
MAILKTEDLAPIKIDTFILTITDDKATLEIPHGEYLKKYLSDYINEYIFVEDDNLTFSGLLLNGRYYHKQYSKSKNDVLELELTDIELEYFKSKGDD